MEISVCISTYQRPEMLRRLLGDLASQETGGRFSYEVVVADNDSAESARNVVQEMAGGYPVPLTYCGEPRRSIAHVRNMTLARSAGGLIAFIDDDEFPIASWLLQLWETLDAHSCAGVLGPVRPHYPDGTPSWVVKGGFFDRPEHPTGFVMPWGECRTGNVLFRRGIIKDIDPVFRPEFGTAGSDVDFFRRMIATGHQFVWCNEAVVHEAVPLSRSTRSYLLKRALLRGGNYFQHPEGRLKAVALSAVAMPIYTVWLPFLFLAGQHHFMKYLAKWCYHVARLLSPLGVRLVKTRPM